MVRTNRYPDEVQSKTFYEARWPIDKMFVDERTGRGGYARPLNPRRVKALEADWDEQSIGVILLSMREDGNAAVIDGRHRAHVAASKGRTSLPALVYIDLTIEDEARLYRRFGEVLSQSARDRFLAALIEGDPLARDVNAILIKNRLHVSPGGQVAGGIQAVNALMSVAKQQGLIVLDESLALLYNAFGVEPKAYTSDLILGTALFTDRYRDAPAYRRRYANFSDRLASGGLTTWRAKIATFRAGGNQPGNAAGQSLLAIFNGGRGEKLSPWLERSYTPEQKAVITARLRKNNDKAVAARKAKAAAKRAARS